MSSTFSRLKLAAVRSDWLEFGRTRIAQLGLLAALGAAAIPAIALYRAPLVPSSSAEPVQQTAVTEQAPPAIEAVRSTPAASPVAATPPKKIQALADFLSRKYRVSSSMTQEWVRMAYEQGSREGVDPLLVIAVMAVESSLNPIAESVAGAKGLMQVIPRFHKEKFPAQDDKSVMDPENNIQAGARILKDTIRRGGSLVAGLQLYNGAPSDAKASYANKVIAEQQRLKQAIRSANPESR